MSAAWLFPAAWSTPRGSRMILPMLTRTSEGLQLFVVSGCMRSPASLPDAAVHGDALARDVARLVRGEEHGEHGHLLGSADATHRDPFADLLRRDADEGPAHVRLDQPRRDRGDRHPVAGQLVCERAR